MNWLILGEAIVWVLVVIGLGTGLVALLDRYTDVMLSIICVLLLVLAVAIVYTILVGVA